MQTHIIEELYIGNMSSGICSMTSMQFHFVLNCAKECKYTPSIYFKYKYLPISDIMTETVLHLFDLNADLIEKYISHGKSVLVHCFSGKSRSGVFILAYLMKNKNMALQEAYNFVRAKRKILPNIYFMEQLIEYDKTIYGKSSFDLNKYIVTFISETYQINKNKVEKIFNENDKEYDSTIDRLFPLAHP